MSATMEQPTTSLTKRKRKYRFRILHSEHTDNHPDGGDIEVSPGVKLPRSKTYHAKHPQKPWTLQPGYTGDIIETDFDLRQMNGEGNMMPKFEKLDDDLDALATINPFLTQPAPGETQEEFQVRMARLTGAAPEAVPAKPVMPDLKALSTKQLIQYAQKERIDLKGANQHADILKLIEAAKAE